MAVRDGGQRNVGGAGGHGRVLRHPAGERTKPPSGREACIRADRRWICMGAFVQVRATVGSPEKFQGLGCLQSVWEFPEMFLGQQFEDWAA